MEKQKPNLGWKTILGSLAAGAILVVKGQGWLDAGTADTLLGFALAFAGYGARVAIAKSGGAQ
ncbi:MAG TPA: hypothetical protein DCQ64_24025 [Candidatus Rokubacteria bacterium]|nr:hypothetical protein [Candidatus Rokubacteria bacterium]